MICQCYIHNLFLLLPSGQTPPKLGYSRFNVSVMSVSSLPVAPKVRLTPEGPLRVRMGDPVSVECRATGRPRPTLNWKRQGSTLQLVTRETNDANIIQVKHEHRHFKYFHLFSDNYSIIADISFLSGPQSIQMTQEFIFARLKTVRG